MGKKTQEFKAGDTFNRHPNNVNCSVLVIWLLPEDHYEFLGLINVKEQVIVSASNS